METDRQDFPQIGQVAGEAEDVVDAKRPPRLGHHPLPLDFPVRPDMHLIKTTCTPQWDPPKTALACVPASKRVGRE